VIRLSSYKSGYLVELKARDELLRKGAKIVVRSSRSLTPIDLIALFPEKKEIWVVQVKGKQSAPKNIDVLKEKFKELKDLEGNYICRAFLYMKVGRKYNFIPLSGGEV